MELLTIDNIVKAYYWIAIASTALYVLKMIIFSLTGADCEVDADFTSIADSDSSFDFLSIQSILAFLMGFGWVGLAALNEWGVGLKLSFVYSVLTGIVFMALSAWLMSSVKKFNQINKIDLKECVGEIAKAYTDIHPKSEGQIEITINSKMTVRGAFNNTEEEIKAFEQIKVTDVKDDVLYIEKI